MVQVVFVPAMPQYTAAATPTRVQTAEVMVPAKDENVTVRHTPLFGRYGTVNGYVCAASGWAALQKGLGVPDAYR